MIRVEGLRELTRGLRRVSAELPGVVQSVNRDIANEVVVSARQEAMSLPGRSKFARLIGPAAGKDWAGVRVSARHKAAGGWLFGALQYRRFRPWIGNKGIDLTKDTYAVGPAIQMNLPRLERDYHTRIGRALRKAFPEGF